MTFRVLRSMGSAWGAGAALIIATTVVTAHQQTPLPPPTKRVEPPPDTTADGKAVEEFDGNVKAYAALHQKFEAALPKLPKEATPPQIDLISVSSSVSSDRLAQLQAGRHLHADDADACRRRSSRSQRTEGAARHASVMDENPVA